MLMTKFKMALAAVCAISLIGTAGFYGSTWASDKAGQQENSSAAAENSKGQPEAPQSMERRLANLEKQMARLLDEIKSLKNELKGKEAVIEDKTLKHEPKGKDASVLEVGNTMKIFQLKHTKAEAANNILWKLFNSEDRQIRMVADPRTNSIFVSADNRSMEEIMTVLSKIDVPEEKKDASSSKK